MTKEKLRRPPPGYMAEHIFAAMKLTVYLFQCWPLFCRSCPFAPQPVLPTSSETWAGEVNGNWVFSTHVDASEKRFPRFRSERRAVQQRNRPKGRFGAGTCLGIVVHGSQLGVLVNFCRSSAGFRLFYIDDFYGVVWTRWPQALPLNRLGRSPNASKTILRTFHF